MKTRIVIPKQTVFPDCLKCVFCLENEYKLIQCQRPKGVIIPHPNCKAWKVNCKFYNETMKKEFRILAHEHEGKTKLQVHEVLYAGDSPVAYETEPFFISGGSILDLLHLINEISECYEKPILWGGKKFPAVHITQLCDICGSSNIIEAPHMGMNCNDCHPL